MDPNPNTHHRKVPPLVPTPSAPALKTACRLWPRCVSPVHSFIAVPNHQGQGSIRLALIAETRLSSPVPPIPFYDRLDG
ncbi:hypothetical protein BDZ91DRAFT_743357 [Kalaharituber pfeilii]|nr:hypothetical protein BDZ91DRAFT_743357 [Kalaharituber pfeilii]